MYKSILIILLLAASISFAQFKDTDKSSISVHEGITNSSPSSFFSNFFNPNNFQMSHSVGMSYSAFGGNGVALSTYTNSMAYKFSENLLVELDASLVASPYSSFGSEHQKSINGIYLTRAELSYSPSKNTSLSIRFFNPPPGSYFYGGSYGGFSSFNRRFERGF